MKNKVEIDTIIQICENTQKTKNKKFKAVYIYKIVPLDHIDNQFY